jgi:hypothetical protein
MTALVRALPVAAAVDARLASPAVEAKITLRSSGSKAQPCEFACTPFNGIAGFPMKLSLARAG